MPGRPNEIGVTSLNLVACWNDALSFDHQDHRSSRRPGSVHHSLGHRESLLGIELHGAPLQIDDEFALDDIEEFIFLVVLVPVKFTLYHAEANDAIIHLAECLVKPLVFRFLLQSSNIDQLQGIEPHVRVNRVWRLSSHCIDPSIDRLPDMTTRGAKRLSSAACGGCRAAVKSWASPRFILRSRPRRVWRAA